MPSLKVLARGNPSSKCFYKNKLKKKNMKIIFELSLYFSRISLSRDGDGDRHDILHCWQRNNQLPSPPITITIIVNRKVALRSSLNISFYFFFLCSLVRCRRRRWPRRLWKTWWLQQYSLIPEFSHADAFHVHKFLRIFAKLCGVVHEVASQLLCVRGMPLSKLWCSNSKHQKCCLLYLVEEPARATSHRAAPKRKRNWNNVF